MHFGLQISHVKWIAILPPWKIIVFKMSKLCPSSLGRLSSVILKFDCAAQFAHSPKTLHFCIKTFSPAQQKFWGRFHIDICEITVDQESYLSQTYKK